MASRIFCGIAGGIFGLDMILKQSIEKNFRPGEERCLAGGRICLRKVYNQGAALNLMQEKPELLKKLSAALVSAAVLYDAFLAARGGQHVRKLAMALYTGGAMSNLYDRLRRGKVIDYIGFRSKWKKLEQLTWNLGDFAILAGAVLFLSGSRRRFL